jgi:alpha-ribazole phosphatase
MRIHLIRHPPPLVEAGVCYGQTDLLCAPAQQAATLAEALPLLPPSLAGLPIISSPLRRCADLALALAQASHDADAPVRFDARLMEMHFGAWEMQRWDDIAHAEVNAWRDDLLNYLPGGGESLLQMTQRVHAFYLDLLAGNNAQTIVVAHSGSMRVLMACAPGRSIEQIAAAVRATRSPVYGEVVLWEPQR